MDISGKGAKKYKDSIAAFEFILAPLREISTLR